ncbi:MAG: hypothetical protein AAGJ46_00315 [Planctomycetota bacterium]
MRLMLAAAAALMVASSVGCQSMKPGCGAGCGTCPPPSCGCDDCGPTCECGPSCGCGGECCGDAGCCGGGGCGGYGGCNGCGPFGGGGAFGAGGGPSCLPLGAGDSNYNFNAGPPVGAVAYPYYTTRGPRDFLAKNPMPIGPTGAYGCRP